jgi:ribosomal-protein-alanine N-acetyltransferase
MSSSPQIKCIRPMTVLDIDRVMEIAARLSEAPQWGRAAFVQALEAESAPRRIALVAEEASGAKAPSEDAWPMYGLKPVPFNDEKPVPFNDEKPVPFNDEKPVPFNDEKPVPFNDEKPVPFNDEKPVPFNDEKPVPFNDEKPVPFNDEKPVPFNDEKPVPFNDEKPVPFNDEKPVPFNDEKPVPFNDEKPVPFNDEKPESFSERKDGTEWAEGERSGIVGFAVASVLAPESELELIAVCPEAQRRGVARRLFEDLAAELSAAGAAEVNLEVRAGNRAALGLYRKLGFVESGRRKGYYQNPVEDALQLRLGL